MATPNTDEKVDYSCVFSEQHWRAADWLLVKRPDWDHYGDWRQYADFIENVTPMADDPAALEWKPEEGFDWGGKLITQTHAGMVYGRPVNGDFVVASSMAFTYRMAPSIVFGTLVPSARPTHQEYLESWEIVLWDEGINVWQQTIANHAVQWTLIGYAKHPFHRHTRYTLEVRRTKQTLDIRIDALRFGLLDPTLPAQCYVGITGCEGVNRFYDFRVEQ